MWPYPKVIAHRGGGTLAPENTLAAMQCGLDRGFHAVEFDVMLSKDGIPVLMHDPEFGRTVAGQGSVPQTLAADLLKMDAGKWFGEAFAGESVPTYEMVALFCQQHGIWMNVEIKPAPGYEKETGNVVAKLTRQLFSAALPPNPMLMQALPLFSSFSFDALMSAKLAAPDIPRGFLMDKITPDWLQQLQELEAVALHTSHKNLTPELAAAVKQAGYGLFCYTVNLPERATEILGWGVDAFCTDRIDLIGANFI
ncbi:glycerophosphodiester phosphodiesterase [Undibacterium terreum]|uniref:Glycerophosphoryl diester phosphodiesterase n=1 Tax=Undibacterium terreum TaxID=1224302 RepID=A0A916UI79_9BURK|nr:glycerophosphodiester phosphodiesterase [Undibacterium terreum]GGC73855.1 glycerophosphoryl diester phosphodiesterase [Undibacterium terreum]